MITLNNPPGPAAVTAAKASILPTTSLLGVAGTMIPADVKLSNTTSTSYIQHGFGSFQGQIGGDMEFDTDGLGDCYFGTLNFELVGTGVQFIYSGGADCGGGVVDDPTAPWKLTVTKVGVGGDCHISLAGSGLGELKLTKATSPTGVLDINISSNPLHNDAPLYPLEALCAIFDTINLDTTLTITDIPISLNATCWQHLLIHMSTHAASIFTTDPHTITVSGADAVTAGVDGAYVWSPADGKFVNDDDADLTIYYAAGKYSIFDGAVLQFKCSTLVSAIGWQTPAAGATNIVTVLTGPL